MKIENGQIRNFRLHAHHLDRLYPEDALETVAGACGLQNSPPGAWETALFNRIQGCASAMLQDALYEKKRLLQAWSYRGVPVVFPTDESDVFLSVLIAEHGEAPWIYTQGIALALDFLQMPFEALLEQAAEAAAYLDGHTVQSKETLDKTLAEIMRARLPAEKQRLWNAPSMYGNPQRHIVGEAVVSFLLRPLSFRSLVVFAERSGISPTFTSYRRWLGRTGTSKPEADQRLARKFLHCYGPATVDSLAAWLGCSQPQARRIWQSVAEEIVPVQTERKTGYMLAEDMQSLSAAGCPSPRILLLSAHDPYLDQRDRTILLENKALHQAVWKTVANPGAVIRAGRIIGIWKTKKMQNTLDLSIELWEAVSLQEKKHLEILAEDLAAFRRLRLRNYTAERKY